jgi:hypothetical protein
MVNSIRHQFKRLLARDSREMISIGAVIFISIMICKISCFQFQEDVIDLKSSHHKLNSTVELIPSVRSPGAKSRFRRDHSQHVSTQLTTSTEQTAHFVSPREDGAASLLDSPHSPIGNRTAEVERRPEVPTVSFHRSRGCFLQTQNSRNHWQVRPVRKVDVCGCFGRNRQFPFVPDFAGLEQSEHDRSLLSASQDHNVFRDVQSS